MMNMHVIIIIAAIINVYCHSADCELTGDDLTSSPPASHHCPSSPLSQAHRALAGTTADVGNIIFVGHPILQRRE
jgi:hypothetical protein